MIVGIMNRCGTNMLSRQVRLHPTFASPTIAPEAYLLENIHHLESFVHSTVEHWNQSMVSRNDHYVESLKNRLCRASLDYLNDFTEPEKRLLLRTPRPFGVERALKLFRPMRLILLLRDGRDLVESAVRTFSYLSYHQWMRRWAGGARTLLDFVNSASGRSCADCWRMVRFEDLVARPTEQMGQLLEFLEADPAEYPWDELEDMPVYGSSTLRGQSEQVHWQPVARERGFQPVGRWHDWPSWRKWQFKLIAGRELVQLGYESSVTGW